MAEVEVIKARQDLLVPRRGIGIEQLRVAPYCRVSTDDEEQLDSYKSQVTYYKDLINKKKEWILVDIYADEAITGTMVTKREDFQRMINDCLNGDIDMIITKSISRFARNTLDTLRYVRMLKEKNIAVFFEEENINTLTMDGELLLVILSSVAQQEVENISAHVKKGLKMKMQRGELVGFQGCLGYDYNPEDKSLTVNEEEAKTVQYIFQRYIEGAGGSIIARELKNLGAKTKKGTATWAISTVMGVIKNEKYKGDILQGKTFTVDPISKRRLENFGEEDQFYVRNHHEPIISAETFAQAQEIRLKRSVVRSRVVQNGGKREKFSRQYAFSCMIKCGFCGSTLTRRSWHSGTIYNKITWQCVKSTKMGKQFCPDSKAISEEAIEKAFVESYRLLCSDNKEVVEDFLKKIADTLNGTTIQKELLKIEKSIETIEGKKNKLIDMRLEETLDKETYDTKYAELLQELEIKLKARDQLASTLEDEAGIKRRMSEFKKVLEKNGVLDTFDRYVFESVVEKVIIGGIDEDGNKDPAQITFVYKTGLKSKLKGGNFRPIRKNAKSKLTSNHQSAIADKLCSDMTDEAEKLYPDHSVGSCGIGCED
ncbi:recombinase [Lucifera butyrica]|uniref:Recombinase n=1 Tax=Lucifera butyrica TaxID=1351585 RepID=A0A498RCM8_9FIRM|nr:recombinase family protein [Lucifera butyrica]VBB08640.1 recombinase [Lucifera butyrica]